MYTSGHFLQGWRAEAGPCRGGRPWLLWHLMSGDSVSSSCCRDAKGRGCEDAGEKDGEMLEKKGNPLQFSNHPPNKTS